MKQFVEKVQGNDKVVGIDTRMSGPYTARKPTNETFAKFCSRDARDRVLQALKETSIKTANGNTIKVFNAKTEFIRSRDWAMGKSEEFIKTKLEREKLSATVKYEKGKELRRITVDGRTPSCSASRMPMANSWAISRTSSCLRGRGVAQPWRHRCR